MSKHYHLKISEEAQKQLRKMDQQQRTIILRWLNKNINNCENPRWKGKSLTGNRSGEWSYRIGNYRVLAEIDDGTVTVLVFKIAHRSTSYRPI